MRTLDLVAAEAFLASVPDGGWLPDPVAALAITDQAPLGSSGVQATRPARSSDLRGNQRPDETMTSLEDHDDVREQALRRAVDEGIARARAIREQVDRAL